MRFQIEQIDNLNIINMKETNYIDHRFPCADMIKHIIVGKGCIAPIDIHGEILYFIIQD